jgi:hypothetical protein
VPLAVVSLAGRSPMTQRATAVDNDESFRRAFLNREQPRPGLLVGQGYTVGFEEKDVVNGVSLTILRLTLSILPILLPLLWFTA